MREGHLEETLRRILAGALAHDVQDPRVGFVTVSEVRLNRDRTVAEVFYTVLGDEEQRETTLAGLKSCRKYLRQRIGQETRLRTLPELRFRYDASLDRSFRLEAVLDEVGPSGDADGDAGDGPDESRGESQVESQDESQG